MTSGINHPFPTHGWGGWLPVYKHILSPRWVMDGFSVKHILSPLQWMRMDGSDINTSFPHTLDGSWMLQCTNTSFPHTMDGSGWLQSINILSPHNGWEWMAPVYKHILSPHWMGVDGFMYTNTSFPHTMDGVDD
ncbi:hypothetical protein AVEN_12538-1 [Araneus ventricosus]|uniref:Uncharacterized protein n=1 Tax=Araneus ventricosus TaxID=182803 RepID=A0A4Y2TNE1_ARAVE|nr:hypothetical protein AVEN_12538-1 [Araneus ventricosus]